MAMSTAQHDDTEDTACGENQIDPPWWQHRQQLHRSRANKQSNGSAYAEDVR